MKTKNIYICIPLLLSLMFSFHPSTAQEFSEELDHLFSISNLINKKILSLKPELSDAERIEALKQYIQTLPAIEKAGSDSDNDSVWYQLKNGLQGSALINSESPVFVPKYLQKKLALKDQNLDPLIDFPIPGLFQGAIWGFIALPFYFQIADACKDSNGEDDFTCDSVEDFPGHDLTTTRYLMNYFYDPMIMMPIYNIVTMNEEVNVDYFRGLFMVPQFGSSILYINSHGGSMILSENDPTNFICTGEEITRETSNENLDDLMRGKLSVCNISGKMYFAINPSFVRKYLQKSDQVGLNVYVNACSSYTETMANAFLEGGALSYGGYTGKITYGAGDKATKEFFTNLAKGQTVEAAHTWTTPVLDPKYPNTQFKTKSQYPDIRYYNRIRFDFFGEKFASAQAQAIAAENYDNHVIINSVITKDEDILPSLNQAIGQFSMKFDRKEKGIYNLEQPGSKVLIEFTDRRDGSKWYASKKCLEENPLCLCTAQIEVTEYPEEKGRSIEGNFQATLVNSKNVTDTRTILGYFKAFRK